MMMGCCSGFTCVTSAINVNYGVCISGGNGGRVSSGTGLISPFSENIEQEIAAMQADPSFTGTGTTDVQTPEERRAERKTRRDTRQTTRKNRRTTRKSNLETRRTARRTERDTQEEADRIAAGPRVEGEIFSPGGINGPETLKITNRDIDAITVTKIESRLDPGTSTSLTQTIQVGASFNFFSNEALFQDDVSGNGELAWTGKPICPDEEGSGAGFRVYVSFSTNAPNREYEFLCDTPLTLAPLAEVVAPLANNRRRKKRKQQQRASRRQKAKNGNGKKGKGRGKGKR
jgi:hypothetical protein